MSIQEIINNPNSKWLEGTGPHSDIVISSRVRLARNLEEFPFPQLMNESQAQAVLAKVTEVLAKLDVQEMIGCLEVAAMRELPALDRQVLVEKHLVSPFQAQNTAVGRGMAVRPDEAVSIMINEEDHLRIQCLLSGLQVQEAWLLATAVDDALEKHLDFAFDEQWGYLTACPTNVGTGLRASVMLHLPGLVMVQQAQRVLAALHQIGLAVRGMYGEGTQAIGNIFQISNQITMGPKEEELVGNLEAVVKTVVEQEYTARRTLLHQARLALEDRTWRALGLLTQARVMTSQEAMTLLSDLRLGVDLGILPQIELRTLNELIVLTRPGYLQKLEGAELPAPARDVKRAEIIRGKLQDIEQ